MVGRIRIQVWDEALELSKAFQRLQQAGLDERALQTLIEQLVIERSLRDYNIQGDTSSARLAQRMADYRATLNDAQKARLDQEIQEAPDLYDRLLNRLLAEERLEALKRKVIPSPVVQDAFMTFKDQRESVLFQLLRVNSDDLARELYFRIQHDHQDFDTLARQYSQGKEAEQGGLVGPIPLTKLKPLIREQLRSLSPGECSVPFSADSKRWLMVRLLRRDSVVLTSDIEKQLRASLFEKWLHQQAGAARSMPGALTQSQIIARNPETCKL